MKPEYVSAGPITLFFLVCLSFTFASGSDAPPALFQEVGKEWGLTRPIVYGGQGEQRYILEGHGAGVAVMDYDGDGLPDLFFTNGSRLEGFGDEPAPVSLLYRNFGNRFVDVTETSGVGRTGWGQGVCVGDYDNDGWTDLYVTYYGHNLLYRNRGDGTFEERAKQSKVAGEKPRWGTGCTFVDYDRDGDLDLFVANYVGYQHAAAFEPGSKPECVWLGAPVPCGPRGLERDFNLLYQNNGDGTFRDVSDVSKITSTEGYYSFQPVTADFDDDGWPDIYVSCDSTPNILYRNNRNGTFTDIGFISGSALSGGGHEQAGMGVAVTDYDRDGRTDILVTNFVGDTPTLYQNLGGNFFSDVTLQSGLGRYLQYLGWGALFFDWDNNGWQDLLMVNGHVYKEVDKYEVGSYLQSKLLYRNHGDGTFEDVSREGGPAILEKSASRGAACADFDADGDLDLVVTRMKGLPSLLLNQTKGGNWIMIRLVGEASNQSAIGARVILEVKGQCQSREVRSASSFFSSNGLRLHFGLAKAKQIDRLTVHWPSGKVSTLTDLAANRVLVIREKDDSSDTVGLLRKNVNEN